ncbi:MAG: methylmalonyl-CoA mutase, partial [Dehalococcoidia bacterium]
LSGAHMELFPQILDQLKARELDDRIVLAGGIIPEDDIPPLKEMGIKEVFGPGTNTQDIIAYIRDVIDEARKTAT